MNRILHVLSIQVSNLLSLCLLGFFLGTSIELFAQLDNLHYLPPIKPKVLNNSKLLTQSEVILSTSSTTAITVNAQVGTNPATTSYTVIKGSPVTITQPILAGGNDLVATNNETGVVIGNKGIKFSSAGKFLVTYKAKSTNNRQAEIYTSKGRAALGKRFRWCGIPLRGNHQHKNAYMSIMAVEDNTRVSITGLATGSVYRRAGNISGIPAGPVSITLNEGECYILETVMNTRTANQTGFLGALVESTKPVVMNNGHALGGYALAAANNSRDILMEQNIPENLLGTQYIAIQGNGTDAIHRDIELVVLTATVANTNVSVNGVFFGTIAQAGDYLLVDGNNYITGAMSIVTDNPVYCYQQVLGANSDNTNGMNLIPPVDNDVCLPSFIDDIPLIEDNNGLTMVGGVQLFTKTGATVHINGVLVPAVSLIPVAGLPTWSYHRSGPLTGNISVTSTESMAVGVLTVDGNAGCAGYYSGFGKRSSITPSTSYFDTLENCFDTLFSEEEYFDRYEWVLDGSILTGEQDSFLVINQQSGNYRLITHWNACVDTTDIALVDCYRLLAQELAFKVENIDDIAFLEWETREDVESYQVQHSKNGMDWRILTTLAYEGQDYLNFQHTLETAGAHYYRIQYQNSSGEVFSRIEVIHREMEKVVYLLNNPVNDVLRLRNIPKGTQLILWNTLGEMVESKVLALREESLAISAPKGVYFLYLYSEDGIQFFSTKIINE